MDFAKGLLKAYETKWSFINTFTVQIQFPNQIKQFIKWTNEDERGVNINIVSIDTPQFSNAPIESFIGDRWVMHNGRDEMYRFSITFRDQDQMSLYKKFVSAYLMQRQKYLDEAVMTITLWKDADYLDDDLPLKPLFNYENVLIDSVSQVQFNNTTENQIAEFTLQFKTTTPIIDVQF
jgi:hypothetical protein